MSISRSLLNILKSCIIHDAPKLLCFNCGIPCRTSEFNLVVISIQKPLISLTQPLQAARQTRVKHLSRLQQWGEEGTMNGIINKLFDAFQT